MDESILSGFRAWAAAAANLIDVEADPERVIPRPEYASKATASHQQYYQHLMENSGVNMVAWLVRWATSGFPQIELSEGLAASLMATSMGKVATASLQVPWDAFLILLPPDMLRLRSAPDRPHEALKRVHVLRWPSGTMSLITSSQTGRWSAGIRPLEAIGDEDIDANGKSAFYDHDLEDEDTRVLGLIDRLFLGVCAELSAPKAQEAIRRHRVTVPAMLRRGGEPKAWTYAVRRYVKVDCRAAIRQYAEGTLKRAPTVQTLVRGHWRRVHHGDGGSLVKWVPIDPYWRGPEDAPIVTRPHVIEAGPEDSGAR